MSFSVEIYVYDSVHGNLHTFFLFTRESAVKNHNLSNVFKELITLLVNYKLMVMHNIAG